jgi:hypothetical protein
MMTAQQILCTCDTVGLCWTCANVAQQREQARLDDEAKMAYRRLLELEDTLATSLDDLIDSLNDF